MISPPLAVLRLSRRINDVVAFAAAVAAGLRSHPAEFPSPNPPLATFEAHIELLRAAQVRALSRTRGAREERDVCLLVVRGDLRSAQCYVQEIVDGRVDDAAAVIEAAGMTARRAARPARDPLTVYLGRASGSVRLVATAAADRASYDWQVSEDGETWRALPSTLGARTTLSGLVPVRVYYFRVRSVTKRGVSDWGDPVSRLVL
jgi:hypothetical protein